MFFPWPTRLRQAPQASLLHLAFLPGSQCSCVSGKGTASSCLGPVQVLLPAAHSPGTPHPLPLGCGSPVPAQSMDSRLFLAPGDQSPTLSPPSQVAAFLPTFPQTAGCRGQALRSLDPLWGPGAHCIGCPSSSSLPAPWEKVPSLGEWGRVSTVPRAH